MKDDPNDFFMSDDAPEPPPPDSDSAPISALQGKHTASVGQEVKLEAAPPANVDAEKTVLGAVLLDEYALEEAIKVVESDDFFLDSHRRIFQRMIDLRHEKVAVDLVTLVNRLNRHKEIEAIGGVAYLASLTEGLPRRPVIGDYLHIIRDKSVLRQLMTISSSVMALAADQSTDSIAVIEQLDHNLAGVKERARLLLAAHQSSPFFVGYKTFISEAPEEIEWTVNGIIQSEGNGLIIGDSGTSKSMLAYDLALHLVAGTPWFQHAIPRRRKVGLVSREDAPGLCQSRIRRMIEGGGEALGMWLDCIDMEEWLYFNTRAQRETWTLQSEADVQDIIASIKEREIEFIVIDVFREVWQGNENDNQETAKVLGAASRIGSEGKCQVAIIHHLSKSEKGTIFDRARGGGINGWKEWGIGVTVENPDADPRDHIRKLHFHTKADCASPAIYYRIVGDESSVRLDFVENYQAPSYAPQRGKKKKGSDQSKIDYGDE